PVRAAIGSVIPLDEAIAALAPILENAAIEKVGHNLKYDIQIFRRYGVRVAGLAFDTMIAGALLDPILAGRTRGQWDPIVLAWAD
ncbi:MAG: hypothetical protein IIA44_07890, partial [Acidobacteria bacterium]|nr:hypothetical protein [Acidobacteriota bacterium]